MHLRKLRPEGTSKFLPSRPENNLVYVHLVRLADGKRHRARERIRRDGSLCIEIPNTLPRFRIGDAIRQLRRDRAWRDHSRANVIWLDLLPQTFGESPHRKLR